MIRHVGHVDDVGEARAFGEDACAADEPDLAERSASARAGERVVDGHRRLDVGHGERTAGDHDVASVGEGSAGLVEGRAPHDDDRVRGDAPEAAYVTGVMPGNPPRETDDAFGRDRVDDADHAGSVDEEPGAHARRVFSTGAWPPFAHEPWPRAPAGRPSRRASSSRRRCRARGTCAGRRSLVRARRSTRWPRR